MDPERRFRERARAELQGIAEQVQGLLADRDVYGRFEREVVARREAGGAGSAFVDLVRAAYTDAMTARLMRMLDAQNSAISLRRVLADIRVTPELLHGKLSLDELEREIASLDRLAMRINTAFEPHFTRRGRTLPTLAASHRLIDEVVERLVAIVQTYYWVVGDKHIDLQPTYREDPLAIFRSQWPKTGTLGGSSG